MNAIARAGAEVRDAPDKKSGKLFLLGDMESKAFQAYNGFMMRCKKDPWISVGFNPVY